MSKKTINIESIRKESKLGKVYEISADVLVEKFNNIVKNHIESIDLQVKLDNEEYEWNKEPDMTTEHGIAKYFIKNFYINYQGNPSQNGGFFYFGKGKREHLNKFKEIINYTLSCSCLLRDWGYGRNQLGMKFVEEDLDTSNKFVDYLINYNVVNLDEYVISDGSYGENEGEKIQTYGHAILLYLIRSDNFDRARDFLSYADESFKKAVAFRMYSFFDYIEGVDRKFIKGLMEWERNSWRKNLEEKITSFLFLSELYPTAFLDKYTHENDRRDYERFKYQDLNTTLNIIDDNDNITIRDSWRQELEDFFVIKKIEPVGELIRVNGEENYLNLGDSGELVIYYKEYDESRSEKENYLNPQVYGILVECNGETHSFDSVEWSHYEYQNAIGELCLELINLGYIPLISSLDPSSYNKETIKYKKNSDFKKIINKLEESEKEGVNRMFRFNWILIQEVNGSYKTRISFCGHYVNGSYVHDYQANYEYEPYLNKILGPKVKWLGYDSSDHSYKYDVTLSKKCLK